jgi:hypothetical protein
MADEETLTESERAEIKDILGYGSNIPDSKQNVHTFLHNVATAKDTTKLGFLKEEEIGSMPNPTRSYKHLALFSGDIMKKEGLRDFFIANSEIITSTSLSRDGFLVDRAVVQKRELKDTTSKPRKQNSSWFKGKDNKEKEEQ